MDLTYKDAIRLSMEDLARDERVVFLGYNTKFGGRAGGALVNIPESQLIEMPLAENLMAGAAIGLSLDGKIPVLYFERFDFVLCAMDAIVNHLDKLDELSEGIHRPAVIIRVVVGNKTKPLFTGATHCQDLTEAMKLMVEFPVVSLKKASDIRLNYQSAHQLAEHGVSSMLVEYKDLY